MKRNRLRVALYIRVSSQEQATEGYSIGEQTERLKKYAEAMDWDIYKIYVDPGYSGGNTDRPGLNELIRDVETGDIDKVVVYKLDRLSRSQLDTLFLIEKVFLANETDFVSMSENFDTSTPFGRAMIGILAVFAQLEREQIKERMGMGKEAIAKMGKWNGGTEPIGYDYNIAESKLIVNEYEKMQILELYDLYLKGVSLRRIETIFIEKGYKHKHGVWDPKAMKRVLRNNLYLGFMKYKGVSYPGEHEPIIDEETYNKAVKLLDERVEAYKLTGIKAGGQTTFLGGIIYCKQCGAKYSKNDWKQPNGNTTKIYACYSRSKKVRKMVKDPNCKNKNWHRDELDGIIFDEIKKLAMDPNYIHELKADKVVTSDEPNKIDLIKKEIANVDAQISRFMDLYGIGKFTIEQVSDKVDPLNEQRKKLNKELELLNAEAGAISGERAIEILESFEDIIEVGDFDEIRMLIESLIYYIELDNDDVYIHWKFA
jgi:site-specific DNA recombinase